MKVCEIYFNNDKEILKKSFNKELVLIEKIKLL